MAQRMLALDLDGTTLNHMGDLSDGVRDAIAALPDEVIVVVATGRSIIATTPILTALGIREGLAVCANGAVTIDLNPAAPSGYAIAETVTFDPRPVLERLRVALPTARIAVEELGVGFKVSEHFPEGELMGETRVVEWDELVAQPGHSRDTAPARGDGRGVRGDGGTGGSARCVLRRRMVGLARHQPGGREQGVRSRAGAPPNRRRAHPHGLRSATSATTSRCSTGRRGAWRWPTHPKRSRPSPTR